MMITRRILMVVIATMGPHSTPLPAITIPTHHTGRPVSVGRVTIVSYVPCDHGDIGTIGSLSL